MYYSESVCLPFTCCFFCCCCHLVVFWQICVERMSLPRDGWDLCYSSVGPADHKAFDSDPEICGMQHDTHSPVYLLIKWSERLGVAGCRVPPPTCCTGHQMASLLVATQEMASLPRVAAHKRTQATTNEHHVVRERPFKKPPRRVFTSVGNNSQQFD